MTKVSSSRDYPLLVVDSSEIDFVDDPGDLEDLLREIYRTVTGAHYYVPRKSERRRNCSAWNDCARVQIIPRKP